MANRAYCYRIQNDSTLCRVRNLVDSQIAQRPAISHYLKELFSTGLLHEVQVGMEKLSIPQDDADADSRQQRTQALLLRA
ncbi:hypothetical protein [Pseudomonas sp. SO81]|uniref:hypothetical protein n=1 Tax=Pseudomonas sp. SO81 TaxID=2983246 RepID=UPI00338E8EFF